MPLRTITLCADDFGLNGGVSAGILQLVRMRRLSAVSCMVNSPDFIVHANELISLKQQVKIGLHFNLTEGFFLSIPGKPCFTLKQLLLKTHLRWINLALIANEFSAQLDQFVRVMHQLPDFIDGHQHVHQFPLIRQVILDLYARRLKNNTTFIRSTWPCINLPHYQFKATVLALTGAKALHKQLITANIPHNQHFAGIYDFAPDTNYSHLFRQWLNLAQENTLIMCHPGDSNSTDSIAHARVIELNYFLSDAFLGDCNDLGSRSLLPAGPKSRQRKAVNRNKPQNQD